MNYLKSLLIAAGFVAIGVGGAALGFALSNLAASTVGTETVQAVGGLGLLTFSISLAVHQYRVSK